MSQHLSIFFVSWLFASEGSVVIGTVHVVDFTDKIIAIQVDHSISQFELTGETKLYIDDKRQQLVIGALNIGWIVKAIRQRYSNAAKEIQLLNRCLWNISSLKLGLSY